MLPPGIDPKGASVEERFQHRKKLPLLKPNMIDQCLPGLRLIRAPDRSREQAPQLRVFCAQAFCVCTVAIPFKQWQQVALFLGEVSLDRRKLGTELGPGVSGQEVPTEAQCSVMLAGELDEAGMALHGGRSEDFDKAGC